jgi:AGCS family alanine or glycine:cation symporter
MGKLWAVMTAAVTILGGAGPAMAQTSEPGGVDRWINANIQPASDFVSSIIFFSVPLNGVGFPLVVGWLIAGALVFTLSLKFINAWGFRQGIRVVQGRYADPNHPGEVSQFQALATALSGTVGLGNIAGVAIAISIGGPGAAFWMMVAGFLGMTTKMVECTMGVKYRVIREDGTVSGGPMYYLSRGLAAQGKAKLGRFLAAFFALMALGGSIGAGNMFQINQAVQQLQGITGGAASPLAGNGWIVGLVVAAVLALVIVGGIKSIARVTDKLVPFMCGLYVIACLVIIFTHVTEIPRVIFYIVTSAFAPEGVVGGVIGALIAGVRRAAFSNEAGLGSAAIAHSAAKTNEPVSEGMVALLEPFIDTIVICFMTAFVVIVTGAYKLEGLDGVAMTSAAFAEQIAWFPYVLTVVVFLFAFSTQISWCYYGTRAMAYLTNESRAAENGFKIIFLVFVVVGASLNLDSVVAFSDAMIFAMAFPNILGLYLLLPELKRDVASYWARVQNGEIRETNPGRFRLTRSAR